MQSRNARSAATLQYSRRDFLRFASTLTGGLTLAACAPMTTAPAPAAQPASGEAAAPATEAVTLRFQNWFNESDMQTWQLGLDKFKQENANVDLKLEFADWGDTITAVIPSHPHPVAS